MAKKHTSKKTKKNIPKKFKSKKLKLPKYKTHPKIKKLKHFSKTKPTKVTSKKQIPKKIIYRKKINKIKQPKKETLPEKIILEPIVLKVVIPKDACLSSTRDCIPNLDKLPPWESRQALKNLIFNKGLKFYLLSRASSDFQTALALLGVSPLQDISGHFVICMKDNCDHIVGALDGYLFDDVLVLSHTYIVSNKKREFQLLLYGAALTKKQAKYVVCYARPSEVSVDTVGLLILLGRGFGMYAISIPRTNKLIFVRRMQKEGPLSTGIEVAHILRSLRLFGGPEIRSAVFEYTKKGQVSLISLPNSQDRKENLVAIKEAAPLLGISLVSLEKIFSIMSQSGLYDKDLTPDTLF